MAFILLKVHTDSCCRSTCRRSAVNLQVVLSKAHTTLGRIYAILYNQCASDKTLGLERSRYAADASRLSTSMEVKNDSIVSHTGGIYDSLTNGND